jgi:tetratricopeptide (TPR) repeat protein
MRDSLMQELARPVSDSARMFTLVRLGQAQVQLRTPEPAIPLLTEAIQLAEKNGDPVLQGKAVGSLSAAYELLGEYKQALFHSKAAVTLLRPHDVVAAAFYELNNGHLLGAYFAKFDAAVAHLKVAISLLENREDPISRHYLAMAYSEGGIASLAAGHREEAAGMLLKALQMQRALGDKYGEAMTCRHLTNVYIEKENYAKAHEYLDKALEINAESGGDTTVLLGVWYNRGEAFAGEGKYGEAIAAFEKAAAFALSIPMYTHAQGAYQIMSTLYKKTGNTVKAREYRAKAKALDRDMKLTDQQAS